MLQRLFRNQINVESQEFVLYLHCILDDAIYETDIFPDSSIFPGTPLVVIDDLRQNLFNAICD